MQLLGRHLAETGLCEQVHQVVHPAASGVEARGLLLTILLMRKINNDHAPSWFENTRDFSQPLTFERSGQMMHHQG